MTAELPQFYNGDGWCTFDHAAEIASLEDAIAWLMHSHVRDGALINPQHTDTINAALAASKERAARLAATRGHEWRCGAVIGLPCDCGAERTADQPTVDLHICRGCGQQIDPDCCHCGDPIDAHGMWSNHSPVPAGCTCGYDRATDQTPAGPTK